MSSPNSPDVLAGQYRGLKPPTTEEISKLSKNKILKIKPNQRALDRVNAEREQKGLPPISPKTSIQEGSGLETSSLETQNNMVTNSATISGTGSTETLSASLIPAQVDNSALAAFPPISAQKSNSCVGWASTYYTMSYEVCLTLGCDNKNLGTKIFSPKWTYNMINSGMNNGSNFSDAFNLIANHGATLWNEFPFSGTDFKSWDLNSTHWKNAINYKMNSFASTGINTDTGIANAKQILTNGHLILIGTYIDSWQYSVVKTNPNTGSGTFTGQSIATYLNGTLGGHAMTIVGYDDSIWVDINNNGVAETSELGAFKIANSWGASWRNQSLYMGRL